MPRINNQIRGTSATYNPNGEWEDEMDLDTADRGTRDRVMRGPMHETHDAEFDARNTPRMNHADMAWRQPQHLDAPPPRPGMAQRWIRMGHRDANGNMDTRNVEFKSRFGWSPRKASSVPEGQIFSSLSGSANTNEDIIRVGNLVLYEIPLERLKVQRAQNREIAKRQEAAVSMDTDRASREGAQLGYSPIVREDQTTTTTGRRPRTLAD